ncbi:MAG TPA: acetyl xylan esterase, partial [Anaerolineae bacterium]|nr:acetyl xylan esterase [Anaerolineae bacterium]
NDTLFRDTRLQQIRRGKNMTYRMPEYNSKEEWEQRAAQLRRHILIVTGLWPMPEKTPLNAKIYDRIDHEDYSIEKVYFESYPGFYVTGNLYRPKGKRAPFPAIISPHGHWLGGRIQNSDVNSVPARGISFARQGYVVFTYDMVGYQDSKQVLHSFADSRMHQLWGISLMGLQLWNSIRALDFITSLPDVDTTLIGCTGASGGGTQTFMVTAVDKRIKVAAPVNMLSASFQGGCLCENAPGLRLQTFNVEIGALAAPRPLLMVSTTQDWTKNTPTVEYPMMKTIYKLYKAEDKLKYVQLDYPHNYNRDSREAVYAWFARWLLGDEDESKYREQPLTVEPPEKMLNFPGKQQPPGDMNEEKLTQSLRKVARKSLQ